MVCITGNVMVKSRHFCCQKKVRKGPKGPGRLDSFLKDQQTGHLQEIIESAVSDLGSLNEFEWEVCGRQVQQIVFSSYQLREGRSEEVTFREKILG